MANDRTAQAVADVINKHPDRFLFGTDVVAPRTPGAYFGVYDLYRPLWAKLTPEAREKVLKTNYLRLFDAARANVRRWEAVNIGKNP